MGLKHGLRLQLSQEKAMVKVGIIILSRGALVIKLEAQLCHQKA
jgi:hypothetical protein